AGEIPPVLVDEIADAEEDLRPPRQRRRAPARECVLRGPNSRVDLLGGGEVDLARQAAGRGVVDRPAPAGRPGDAAAADPVIDGLPQLRAAAGGARLCDLRHRDPPLSVSWASLADRHDTPGSAVGRPTGKTTGRFFGSTQTVRQPATIARQTSCSARSGPTTGASRHVAATRARTKAQPPNATRKARPSRGIGRNRRTTTTTSRTRSVAIASYICEGCDGIAAPSEAQARSPT